MKNLILLTSLLIIQNSFSQIKNKNKKAILIHSFTNNLDLKLDNTLDLKEGSNLISKKESNQFFNLKIDSLNSSGIDSYIFKNFFI